MTRAEFCPVCGLESQGNTIFCRGCGNELPVVQRPGKILLLSKKYGSLERARFKICNAQYMFTFAYGLIILAAIIIAVALGSGDYTKREENIWLIVVAVCGVLLIIITIRFGLILKLDRPTLALSMFLALIPLLGLYFMILISGDLIKKMDKLTRDERYKKKALQR